MSPITVNAHHETSYNQICTYFYFKIWLIYVHLNKIFLDFPFSMLRPPYFDSSLPKYMFTSIFKTI
jgi:hypothetical protein